MIKLVIFDLWSTLQYKRYKKGTVWSTWRDCGLKKCSHRTFLKAYENTFQLDRSKDFDSKYRKLFQKLKIPYTEKMIDSFVKQRLKIENNGHVYSYSIPLLKKLKSKGYKLALLSNLTSVHGEKFKRSRLAKYFNKLFFSYETKVIKPNPKAFKNILKHFKVKPSEAVMIGDNYEDDYKASKKLGLNAIHIKSGPQVRRELKKLKVL